LLPVTSTTRSSFGEARSIALTVFTSMSRFATTLVAKFAAAPVEAWNAA